MLIKKVVVYVQVFVEHPLAAVHETVYCHFFLSLFLLGFGDLPEFLGGPLSPILLVKISDTKHLCKLGALKVPHNRCKVLEFVDLSDVRDPAGEAVPEKVRLVIVLLGL